MTSRRTLEPQVLSGRELVVLSGGPWPPCWYWRNEFEDMQQASRNTGYPDDHPAAVLRGYAPTDEWRPHPDEPDVAGRVWTYTPTK